MNVKRREARRPEDIVRWKRSQKAKDFVARQLAVQNLTIVAVRQRESESTSWRDQLQF
jgi:hypothetical protein